MLYELNLIKALCKYSVWLEYRNCIQLKELTKDLQPILSVIDKHFVVYQTDITFSDLVNLFFATQPKDKELYDGIFARIESLESNDNSSVQTLLSSFLRRSLLRSISVASYESTEGRGDDTKLNSLVEQYVSLETLTPVRTEDVEFVTDDLEQLVESTVNKSGLNWRLRCLNQSIGPLRKGDFGFIFARTETGKTSFLASEVSYMAPQADGYILWINNEEQGSKVMLRCYQAALGMELPKLLSNITAHKAEYTRLTGNKIKIYDSASISKNQVETICKQLQPSLIIFDQIDKIQGFVNDREDLRLGSIYIWARELAKTYAPVIGVCQADGTGEGQKWLTMGNVANSKTSKAAEADWIMGIGKVNDVGYENVRYLNISKNKLTGGKETIPEMRHGRLETLIKPEIARYADIR